MNKFGKAIIFGAAAVGVAKIVKTIKNDTIAREKAILIKDCVVNSACDCADIILDKEYDDFDGLNEDLNKLEDVETRKCGILDKLCIMKDAIRENIADAKCYWHFLNTVVDEDEINIIDKKADDKTNDTKETEHTETADTEPVDEVEPVEDKDSLDDAINSLAAENTEDEASDEQVDIEPDVIHPQTISSDDFEKLGESEEDNHKDTEYN